MIIQATGYVKNGDYTSRYKYILVDEFQDISQSRYKFLKSLLDQDDECKLFCVGDDWQSIYRFTGSDLAIMTDFNRHFSFNEILYLDETFRNNSGISDFSSEFIMKNPSQFKKNILHILLKIIKNKIRFGCSYKAYINHLFQTKLYKT